ncbi:MAG: sodium:solute symporter [Clostridiales bacterium]|nr:sodium:solute symporter [Clostridiales bacterium]
MAIKIVLLLIFFAVMIGVGLYCRKHSTNVNGFVLGGRAVGPWLTAFAYGTSYFSAVIFVGYAGQFGWAFGVSSTWIGLGNAFIGSLLAWTILGRRTRIMTQHLEARTMPEYLGKRYDSSKLKVLASLITFVFLIPYTASLFNGLSRLFEMAFSIDYAYCVIVMAILTGIYVIIGGYMATAINDFVQGIIMLFGIVAVILAVLAKNGGLMASMSLMGEIDSPVMTGAYVSFLGPMPLFLLVVVLLTSLGTWGLPQMVAKFYAITNEGAIKKGTVISTLFAIIVAGGCYFLGGFGRLFVSQEQVDANGFDSIVPTMLSGLPDVLIAVVLVLVLSASMSTLSSLVLTSSSTLTLDFISPLTKDTMSEPQKLTTMRVFVAFFIVVSAAIAIVQAKSRITFIAQLMGVSWGALAGAFLAPFLYGLYWKKTTRAACAVTYLTGTCLMITQLCVSLGLVAFDGGVLGFIFQNSLYSGVFAMLSSLILVPLVSVLTPNSRPVDVENMFTCYDRTITVHAKTALGDEEQ